MISIPEPLWAIMLDELARAPRGVERVAYLDGFRGSAGGGVEHGVVTTVVVPDAILTPGNYRVPAEAMAAAGRHMLDLGLVRLAQVHTHGNDWVCHSWVDDRMAYTRRDGALSIVLPYHARRRPAPLDGGVHLRSAGSWHRLSDDDAQQAVRLVPGLLDFRAPATSKRWRWLPWNR